MIEVVDWGLPQGDRIVSNAVRVDNRLYTVQVPRDPATAEIRAEGDIREQTRLCLENLRRVMEAVGGSLAGVVQIQIFLVDAADAPGMNEVYREFFSPPYPNRAALVVKELLHPGMRVEMVVHAHA